MNYRIKAPQVRVIDEKGQQIGVMDTEKAIHLAQDKGLDLIEVSPVANPPVCKILDRGQFQYQQSKQKQQQKTKKVELKIVKISFKIGQHDLSVKAGKAKKFLEEGHKVKVEMFLRGRERQHTSLAKENMTKFFEENFSEIAKFEQPLKVQGNNLSFTIVKNN